MKNAEMWWVGVLFTLAVVYYIASLLGYVPQFWVNLADLTNY